MILRRFMQHIKEQNWFAVGLDVIVVIVGIFLGIQVSEWNEARKEKNEEQAYLKRIYIENQNSLNESIERALGHKKRVNDVLSIVNYLANKSAEFPTDDAMQNALCRWYAPASARSENFAFDELVSSGRLELISDQKLRLLLQKSQSINQASDFDFNMLGQTVQAKAKLLEPYIHWVALDASEAVIHTDSDNGTKCQFDMDGLKSSRQAQSVLAQLYRSQLIYQMFREEQAEGIKAVLSYMEENDLH